MSDQTEATENLITRPPLVLIDDDFDGHSARQKFDSFIICMNEMTQAKMPRREIQTVFEKEYLPFMNEQFTARPVKLFARMLTNAKGEYNDKMIAACINAVFTENVKKMLGGIYAEIFQCAAGVKVYAARSDTPELKNVLLKVFIAPAKEATKSKAGNWPVYMLEADMLQPDYEPTLTKLTYAMYASEIAMGRHEKA